MKAMDSEHLHGLEEILDQEMNLDMQHQDLVAAALTHDMQGPVEVHNMEQYISEEIGRFCQGGSMGLFCSKKSQVLFFLPLTEVISNGESPAAAPQQPVAATGVRPTPASREPDAVTVTFHATPLRQGDGNPQRHPTPSHDQQGGPNPKKRKPDTARTSEDCSNRQRESCMLVYESVAPMKKRESILGKEHQTLQTESEQLYNVIESYNCCSDCVDPTMHGGRVLPELGSEVNELSESFPATLSVNTDEVGEEREEDSLKGDQGSPVSPTSPEVYVEHVRLWWKPYEKFRSLVFNEEFRFVNLDCVMSFTHAIEALTHGVQEVLDDSNRHTEEGDFVQLQIEGGELQNPVFSFKKRKDQLNAAEFLDFVVSMLQSNREALSNDTLHLIMTISKPPRGGAGTVRKIKSIPYSSVIEKKKRFLVDFSGYNNLCFAGGLMGVMKSGGNPTDAELLESARKLHADLGWSDLKKVNFSDISIVEEHLKVNIQVVWYAEKDWGMFKTQSPRYPDTYFLLLHSDHYYGVLNIKSFTGSRNYCGHCHTLYNHVHTCPLFCRMCKTSECKTKLGTSQKCPNCHFNCSSESCLKRHVELAAQKKIYCPSREWCPKCRSYNNKDHLFKECRGRACKQCGGKLGEDEDFHTQCYLKRLEKPSVSAKYIFYDFECTQDGGEHKPNYVFAKAFREDIKWRACGKSWEFKGEKCMYDFVKTITTKKQFQHTTFIAHNAKAYYSYFIVKQLIEEKMDPELVAVGGKLMCVSIKSLGIKFIDFLNHLPMALSKLTKALDIMEYKGYFPHLFNTEEKQAYVGPLPDPKYYGVEHMMPQEREAFLKWHEENKTKTFDLQKELASYCQQNVDILEEACTLYRSEIREMTAQGSHYIDPLQYLTLASVCFAMYRFKFLPTQSVAILPPDHYHRETKRSSTPSIHWLLYMEHSRNIQIRHALNEGEYKVQNYYLDGYAVVDGKKTAFEFNGCFWHGCTQCYNPQNFNTAAGKTFNHLFNTTKKKRDDLERMGFEVVSIWEHEWNHQKKMDESVKAFLKKAEFPDPLVPRDALFGGRTNAITLYYKAKEGEEIHYYDFNSLYPFVNARKMYPLGHPKIIHNNFESLTQYFGLAKVKVYPPRGLFFPVLPSKVGGKLFFTLCRTCAETKQQEICLHTDEERSLVGTWVTVELEKALAKGYQVVKIFEVWHFEKKSSELFAEYIKSHFIQKQAASGYPDWCVTEADKNKYINTFYEKEGILLDPSSISLNPAKRQIAKLFLNSLWGKFAQKTNWPTTEIVRDPNRYFELLFSNNYGVATCSFISEDAACVSWKHARERLTTSGCTNIYIAAFTTAYARLELYELLDHLGIRCLYHDTDSVMFVTRPGDWNPLLGDFLGELTSEVPAGQHISEFVSAGPKTYGYRLSGGKACLKVKGITLNAANIEKINFDSLKDLVFTHVSGSEPGKITVSYPGIVRDKQNFVIKTKNLQKTQKVVYDKRVLREGFTSVPYGY